jgi:type II secretory pathway pseudopilin PulG
MRQRLLAGFTLVEVAVAAMLIALLAAVTSPYLVSYMDHQRAQTTADQLADLAKGIGAFNAVVKEGNAASTLNTYPGSLWQLDSIIVAANVVSHNSCGSTNNATFQFNATAVTAWTNNGPFVSYYIPRTGLVTPLGTVEDSLVRSNHAAAVGTLALQMIGVDDDDAVMLDLIVDGGDGGTLGTLRYTAAVSGLRTVSYIVPVGAKC